MPAWPCAESNWRNAGEAEKGQNGKTELTARDTNNPKHISSNIMAPTGWQITTLQDPEVIQLEIYGPFSEQNVVSALLETLALAQAQKIDKVLIDKRKIPALPSQDSGDPLGKLAYQLFSGHSKRTALLFSHHHRACASAMSLFQHQAAQTDTLHCFFDREHALHWLTQ
jgi:hypothetical protein